MARKNSTPTESVESGAIEASPVEISIHAESIPSTPAPPRDLEAELRLALARIDELTAALERATSRRPPPTPPESGPGTGSEVTLVEYRGGRIYERQATVVAVRGGGVLGLVVRGDRERKVVDVGPHDAALGVVDRVGYHGYTYADPLAEAVGGDSGLESA